MGLIFRSRRRGFGLTGTLVMLLLIIGAATPWMVKHADGVRTQCMNSMQSMGRGNGLCDFVSKYIETASGLVGRAQDSGALVSRDALNEKIDDLKMKFDMSGIRERWAAINYRIDQGQSWVGGNSLSRYVSMDEVRQMLRTGSVPDFGAGADGQLRAATNHFTAGQMSNPSQALSWYKRGANTGQYGIMSQLKLGSLYMGDDRGAGADYGQAYHYNSQALSSLTQLQSAHTPQADAVLKSLPVEPGQLKLQLQEALARLQMMRQ